MPRAKPCAKRWRCTGRRHLNARSMRDGPRPCAKRWAFSRTSSTRRWRRLAAMSGPWPTATSRPGRARRRVRCSSSRIGRARSWRRSKRQSAVRCIASRCYRPSCSPRATPTTVDAVQSVSAAHLVRALLDEFPFEEDEASWVSSDVAQDFTLPGRRDLLYLVMCTITKNALQALRGRAAPALRIEVGTTGSPPGPARSWMRFVGQRPGDRPGGACPPHARAGDHPQRVRRQRDGPDVLPARDAVPGRLHRDRVRGGAGNGDDPLLPALQQR